MFKVLLSKACLTRLSMICLSWAMQLNTVEAGILSISIFILSRSQVSTKPTLWIYHKSLGNSSIIVRNFLIIVFQNGCHFRNFPSDRKLGKTKSGVNNRCNWRPNGRKAVLGFYAWKYVSIKDHTFLFSISIGIWSFLMLSLQVFSLTLGPFMRGKIRRVLNKTQTISYKRPVRRDLAKTRLIEEQVSGAVLR